MRNIKGTLLDMSSDYTKNIIKLIFDNDIEKHSLRDSFLYSNFKNATFLNYQDVVDLITKQEKIFLLFEGKDKELWEVEAAHAIEYIFLEKVLDYETDMYLFDENVDWVIRIIDEFSDDKRVIIFYH
ncbi:hypothetical protein JMN10_13440 [Capnocytophaga genosp. AHN8471]|uniref:Uncharacterized protein n=1 Tax=Capnocytophaga genosp. AHN8471 TaxID=327574 RepID=A0ABS1YZC7_9FLAO|nr:hypothetical protein [Capnocytophaga genosp. AHN8471]MBM0651754.1 hypothetical protein [Capnocytophaga genosp. AHN8471]MBM0663169.1 hypothetical protein [Capnocytophaga genosp. AHN8471]